MTWQNMHIATAGTHHLSGDAPAYRERFDEVLAFHAPGLAPVRLGGAAWHIRPDGQAAYARRFTRTFGFYEGLAAVRDTDGWHHIDPRGRDTYPARHHWCGNFQDGRCTVRDPDGRYFHIGRNGEPAYPQRWRYAGDFRDGLAVVQAEDGRSTHIDRAGAQTHGCWLLDLDAFHKGFARARDESGWMHIDAAGIARYASRFAAVEPFYNGQARVERFDGGLEVIDESGATLIELRAPLRSELAALSADLVGFWRTQTIAAAVELGVFEALPGNVAAIAGHCGLQPERTRRLLRALAELSLATPEGDRWRASARGELLRTEHPWTLAGAAREYARFFPRMWEGLPDALRDAGGWQAPDIFGEVAREQSRCTAHHRMLLSYARHDYAEVPQALGLRGDERIVDAGGGLGALASALAERYPDLRIVLLERPEVVGQAAGFLSCPERIELRAGSLFDPWCLCADAVVLARVLHDWNDAQALRILTRARAALPAGGTLFIVEMVLSAEGAAGGLCDLHLLMATGGQERTADEYAALMERAGFGFREVRRLDALPAIVVGVAQ